MDFGLAAAAESEFESRGSFTLYQETATFETGYHLPRGATFDFGGGVKITPQFGLGVSFAGTAHMDTADLSISIPHPTLTNRNGSDTGFTDDDLERIESHVNIHAVFFIEPSERLRVRVFGGPTYFRMQQDTVSDINYSQSFNLLGVNNVTITGYDGGRIEFDDAKGWGFHAGADVSWFFNRIIGVGGFGKLSGGTVTAFNPIDLSDEDFKVGGFQAGGGLRLRF